MVSGGESVPMLFYGQWTLFLKMDRLKKLMDTWLAWSHTVSLIQKNLEAVEKILRAGVWGGGMVWYGGMVIWLGLSASLSIFRTVGWQFAINKNSIGRPMAFAWIVGQNLVINTKIPEWSGLLIDIGPPAKIN